jgi:Tol biopolymer transport system component
MTGRWTMGSVAAAVVLALTVSLDAQAKRPEVQLEEALNKERISGDIEAAIALLKPLAEHTRPDIAARALVALGRLYDRRGEVQARAAFERVVRQYPNQAEAAKEARAWLAANTPPAPAPAPVFSTRLVWTPGEGLSPITISADGRWMALDKGVGTEIVVRNMVSGELRSISPSSDPPALSKDGRLVAYNFWGDDRLSARDAANKAIGALRVTVNEPNGATRIVAHNRSGVRYYTPLAFTPDGRSLFIHLVHEDWTRQIARVSVETGRIDVIKSLGWRDRGSDGWDRGSLSPDGRYYAYAALSVSPKGNTGALESTDRHIYLLSADASSESVVVTGASVNSYPFWSPDGSTLFFVSNRGGGRQLWSVQIRNGKPQGDPIQVRRFDGHVDPIGMTNAGVIYFKNVAAPRDDIYTARFDATTGAITTPVRMTNAIGASTLNPSWSPDGRLIAVRQETGSGQYQTVILSADTGAVVDNPESQPSPFVGPMQWFHKSRRLLQWSGMEGVQRVDLDTKKITLQVNRITGDVMLTFLYALSPDDETLYAVVRTPDRTARGNGIVAIDMSSGKVRHSFLVPGLTVINGIALSPNGRTLVVTGKPAQSPLEENRARFEQQLARVDVDGTNHQVLVSSFLVQQARWAQTLAWTRDGRHILYGQSGQFGSPAFGMNYVTRIAAQGGTPEPTGLTLSNASVDIDPSGTRVVYSSTTRFDPEVWVMEPKK